MKYMLIMWSATDATSGGDEDFQAWADFQQEATDAGVYVDGQAFTAPAEAHVVKTTLSKETLPDAARPGTFSAGDVQIAAYYLVDVADEREALQWANRLPTYGEVEVRQILEYQT